MTIITLISGLFGLGIGSFLNVLVDRGYRKETLRGRSYCESCHKILSTGELVPIASYLLQKGRCRSCGAALSLQYPLVELITGMTFGLIAWFFPPTMTSYPYSLLTFFALLLAAGSAIAIAVYDIRWQLIPERPLLFLAGSGLIISIIRAHGSLGGRETFFYDAGTALGAAALLFSLWFFSHGRWIGFGDVKLILATSLLVGFPQAISAFLFAFWIGGIAGLFLLLFKKRGLRDEIPFGPFLILGAALSFFIPKIFFPFFILI